MPIILDKPFNAGDLDPSATSGYPMAQLVKFLHNPLNMAVYIEYEFGTATGDHYEKWTRGKGSPTLNATVGGDDVVAMWSQKPQDGECVGEAIRRLTYQYLIDQKLAVGTIADAPPAAPQANTQTTASQSTAATSAATTASGAQTTST